jgi:hypothetical protein
MLTVADADIEDMVVIQKRGNISYSLRTDGLVRKG